MLGAKVEIFILHITANQHHFAYILDDLIRNLLFKRIIQYHLREIISPKIKLYPILFRVSFALILWFIKLKTVLKNQKKIF